MSLQTTARKLGGDSADVTWHGTSFKKRQLRKLGRRQSTTGYDERSVMMPSEDDLEP